MNKYYLSENLKTKRTFINKLVWIAPLLTLLLSFLLASQYYIADSYNWWYIFMLPGSLVILCTYLINIDNSMKNRGILSFDLDLKKVWVSKILVCIKNISISCFIIFIFTNLNPLFISRESAINIPLLNGFLACVILIITFIWQIPLWMIIGKKIGIILSIILSLILNAVGIVIAPFEAWILYPFSYPSRLMCPILKILPNGLPAVPESVTFSPELLSCSSVFYGVVISIILFIITTYFTTKMFEKMEAL